MELRGLKQWSPCQTEAEYIARLQRSSKSAIDTSNINYKGKAPVSIVKNKATYFSYDEAKEIAEKNGVGYGFILSDDDPYIILDVDVDPTGKKTNATPTIPLIISNFLDTNPTVAYFSKSGFGLHILYKISTEERNKLVSFKFKKHVTKETDSFCGDFFFSDGFVVLTEKQAYETSDINTISLSKLYKLIPSLEVKFAEKEEEYKSGFEFDPEADNLDPLSTVEDIKNLLSLIPVESNSITTRAWSKLNKSSDNYSHWLRIGFILAGEAYNHVRETGDLSVKEDLKKLFIIWSSTDTSGSYEGPEATGAKFESLYSSSETRQKRLTIKTLKKLARLCSVQFPVVNAKGNPLHEDLQNFEAVIDFFDLRLYEDSLTHNLYIEGPEQILRDCFVFSGSLDSIIQSPLDKTKHFTSSINSEQLTHGLTSLCQRKAKYLDFKFNTGRNLAGFWISKYCSPYNPLMYWMLEKPWDGKKRVFKYLSTFNFPEGTSEECKEMYRKYIYKSLMLLVARCCSKQPISASGITIFAGAENTHKTITLERIIPEELFGSYFSDSSITLENTGQRKDAQMEVTSHAIIAVNEIDRWFQNEKSMSLLKSFVTSPVDTFRPPYGRATIKRPRMAVLFGTTNHMNLNLSRHGNRRIWFCPIKNIDIDRQNKINRQQMFAELYIDFKNKKNDKIKPWDLTQEEIDLTYTMLAGVKSKTNIDYLVEELFEWDTMFSEEDFFKSDLVTVYNSVKRSSLNTINNNSYSLVSKLTLSNWLSMYYRHMNIKIPGLVQTLNDFCASWTGTAKIQKIIKKERSKNIIIIDKGKVLYKGVYYFILPRLQEGGGDDNGVVLSMKL